MLCISKAEICCYLSEHPVRISIVDPSILDSDVDQSVIIGDEGVCS